MDTSDPRILHLECVRQDGWVEIHARTDLGERCQIATRPTAREAHALVTQLGFGDLRRAGPRRVEAWRSQVPAGEAVAA